MRPRPATIAVIVILAVFVVLLRSAANSVAFPAAPDLPRVPVLVELFTSEGCSSCPPADALLAQLDRAQPVTGAEVIALEEHVDYWNSLGWKDPFSSREFTARQEGYALRFGSTPYTPQMVVDGQTEFVGSDQRRAEEAIASAARAPKVEVSLQLFSGPGSHEETTATVRVAALPADAREGGEVRWAVLEDGLSSRVTAGENEGRHLQHRAVVRQLRSLGRCEAGRPFQAAAEIAMAPGWRRGNLRVVVFVEGLPTRRILGAASQSVPM
jgi:hypothetical protein